MPGKRSDLPRIQQNRQLLLSLIARCPAFKFSSARRTANRVNPSALMHREIWLLLILAGTLWDNTGNAAEFAAADGAYQGKNAPSLSRGASPGNPTEPTGETRTWRLVRSAGANAGPSVSAILHTAEFERSDPRLAGLMLRCGRQGIETVIVVIGPFPPHAQPQITLRTPEQESHFVGTIIPTGAGIRLPSDATNLVMGPWRKARELGINVTDGDTVINGAVALSGLPEALETLNAECVQN